MGGVAEWLGRSQPGWRRKQSPFNRAGWHTQMHINTPWTAGDGPRTREDQL